MIKWLWEVQESAHQTALSWQEALSIPPLTCLTEQEQNKLVTLAERFLQQKWLVPLQSSELDSLRSCRIALLFCLPVLELGLEWLDDSHEVLIYPAPFVVDDEWKDDIGLVHSQRIVQSGQSRQQEPIVLSQSGIQDSLDASSFSLIIHEAAHKLDTCNGGHASGVPFIPLHEVVGQEHDSHAATNNIQEEIELVGGNAAGIDAYAANDPAGCFAVFSKYFFSAPELFAPRFPLLWQRFCQFYQQDPLQRLHHVNDTDPLSATNVH